ncbi:S-adenosyl-L-methionine-dependent methyltransferase [Naviculisporaceae sp. PSN 640]
MVSETTMPEKPAHLDPSELGTKEYWENLYHLEITNHTTNPRDEGTVWFDDSDAQAKMVEFLEEQLDPEQSLESEPHLCAGFDKISKLTARVIDLGCGNGSMLFALREEGWIGRLLGVDYAEKSVALARRIQETRRQALKEERGEGEEGEGEQQWKDVEFQTWDVLNGDYADLLPEQEKISPENGRTGKGTFDLVLDKGTFDAISLSAETDSTQGRRICEGYAPRVLDLMRDDGGLFLITSCNWTEQELKAWIESAEARGTSDTDENNNNKKYRMRQIGRVKYPSFSFGGVQGSSVSTLCFVKEEVV